MDKHLLILLFCLITSFLVALLSIPSIIKVAKIKSLFDVPNMRKAHSGYIPTLGGLAIFAGFLVGLTLWIDSSQFVECQYIIASTIIIFFIGIKDDILITAPMTKMIGQILAALIIMIPGDIVLTNFHGFFGIYEVPYVVGLLTTLLIMITIVNGFNLIDGIDGLASGVAILTSLVFGIWFFVNEILQYALLSISLAGAVLGFFRYNVLGKKNKIFMGDTGSLIIGLIISIMSIKFNEYNLDKSLPYTFISAPSVTFGILVIPFFDIVRVVFVRVFKNRGRGLFSPDRNHIHHNLLRLGMTHLKSTAIILSVNLFFIIFSLSVGDIIPIRRLLLLLLLMAMLLFYIPSFINDRKNKVKKV